MFGRHKHPQRVCDCNHFDLTALFVASCRSAIIVLNCASCGCRRDASANRIRQRDFKCFVWLNSRIGSNINRHVYRRDTCGKIDEYVFRKSICEVIAGGVICTCPRDGIAHTGSGCQTARASDREYERCRPRRSSFCAIGVGCRNAKRWCCRCGIIVKDSSSR